MMSRRHVLLGAAALPDAALAQTSASEAQALYANAIVIDANIYPPVSENMTKAEVERFKSSGITA